MTISEPMFLTPMEKLLIILSCIMVSFFIYSVFSTYNTSSIPEQYDNQTWKSNDVLINESGCPPNKVIFMDGCCNYVSFVCERYWSPLRIYSDDGVFDTKLIITWNGERIGY